MSEYDRLYGRGLSAYPFSAITPAKYVKTATVLAAAAPCDGEVDTPEGVMRYREGDYIVTDNPPTHAWPVQRDVFLRTHRKVGS